MIAKSGILKQRGVEKVSFRPCQMDPKKEIGVAAPLVSWTCLFCWGFKCWEDPVLAPFFDPVLGPKNGLEDFVGEGAFLKE